MVKHCTMCKQELNSINSSPHSDRCRPCSTKFGHEYREKNKEVIRAKYKIRRAANLEVFRKRTEKSNYKRHLNTKIVKGVLDPFSNCGIAAITEHLVCNVLEGCVRCNTLDGYNKPYDLISDSLGTINVKSSKLRSDESRVDRKLHWRFKKNKKAFDPDVYVCIGFDEKRENIEHVWFIPTSSNLISPDGISIYKSNLKRAKQYEVDSTEYINVYKKMDITTIPEFKNIRNVSGKDEFGGFIGEMS